MEFDETGKVTAMRHGLLVLGEHLHNANCRFVSARLRLTGAAIDAVTGNPVRRIMVISRGIDKNEGVAVSIGRFRPAILIVIKNGYNGIAEAVFQSEAFSAIGEVPRKGAEYRDARVTFGKGIGIVVRAEQEPLSGFQLRTFGKGELYPA